MTREEPSSANQRPLSLVERRKITMEKQARRYWLTMPYSKRLMKTFGYMRLAEGRG